MKKRWVGSNFADGTKIEKIRKAVDHAIQFSCIIVFDRTHTPRALLARTVTVLCAVPTIWTRI